MKILFRIFIRSLFIGFTSLALVACKKGNPQISDARALPGFTLDQNSFAVTSKLNPAFILTGKCDNKFTTIDMSFDDGATWVPAASLAFSAFIDCQASGKFRLDFTAGMPSTFSTATPAGQGRLAFRANSDLGFSEIRNIAILQKQQNALILAGSHSTANSTNTRRLTGQLGSSASAQSITSGYRLTGSVVGR